jgi:hypothetical protein
MCPIIFIHAPKIASYTANLGHQPAALSHKTATHHRLDISLFLLGSHDRSPAPMHFVTRSGIPHLQHVVPTQIAADLRM